MIFSGIFVASLLASAAAAVVDSSRDEQRSTIPLQAFVLADTRGRQIDKGFVDWLSGVFGVSFKPIEAHLPFGPNSTEAPPPLNPPKDCPPCKCGLANTQNRIVGGVETKKNYYPWVTLLTHRGEFYCGGSTINSRYILTAAHCVHRLEMNNIRARILVHDRMAEAEEFKIVQIIKHRGYSTTNYNDDIALLKVDREIKFDGTMRPVCLPELGKTFAREKGIVTGWGAVQEAGATSQTLREVEVPILTNEECRNTKYPARRITESMLCAGYAEGGRDSCQGDSGGPLHVAKDSTYSIVGIVSWGEGCAQPNYPGVYTRVNRFVTWIRHNTRDACYC